MIETLHFLWLSFRAFQGARGGPGGSGCYYMGRFGPGGVCNLAIFVGTGREAWRISQRAVEEFGAK
jgi:hypothetical protein